VREWPEPWETGPSLQSRDWFGVILTISCQEKLMKFRVDIVVENDAGEVTKRLMALEKSCNLPDGVSVGLGMTMADGK